MHTPIRMFATVRGIFVNMISAMITPSTTTVLTFPYHFALCSLSVTSFTLRPAKNIIASLITKTTTSAIISLYLGIRQMRSAPCVSLSATGSIKMPNSETWLNFLATQPSRMSVTAETAIRMTVTGTLFSPR